MAVIRVVSYFTIVFLFNANIICGSTIKNYLGSNAPISLFDLLQTNDVDIKRINSNEAEDLIKSIVKQNRINNDRPKTILLNRIIPPDYELAANKIDEGVVKNYVTEDLLADNRSGKNKMDGIVSPNYELVKGLAEKNNKKIKKSLHTAIPPNYELVKNTQLETIPADYELVRRGIINGLIPLDYELMENRDRHPDYELKIKDFITPDYELIKNRDIPPDYELVKDGKLKGLLLPDYEQVIKKAVPPEQELKIKSPSIPPDYDLLNNGYFKPFIRLPNRHSRAVNDESEDDLILVRSPDDVDLLAKFGLFNQPYVHKKKRYHKQNRLLTPKEEKMAINLVKHIQYLVTKIKSPILKRLTLDRILDVLNKAENLRQGREGEEIINSPSPMSVYVPFFNYWTYQKTLIEDDCPDDSVKIGNVCSRTPPH